MPNLVQILSIFLKLQAVKQSGPAFVGLPGISGCWCSPELNVGRIAVESKSDRSRNKFVSGQTTRVVTVVDSER